ncbi:MAG: hypothetical protein EA397_19800 [Deltaproteobacteria bacterium]|nr:MAG: hypothetical protein EA397_19800 [Deltaproteobacteria bacterium]
MVTELVSVALHRWIGVVAGGVVGHEARGRLAGLANIAWAGEERAFVVAAAVTEPGRIRWIRAAGIDVMARVVSRHRVRPSRGSIFRCWTAYSLQTWDSILARTRFAPT